VTDQSETARDLSQQVARFRDMYRNSAALRALVQAIPALGGSIDTLVVGDGFTKMIEDRFETFLEMLRAEAEHIIRTDGALNASFIESQDFAHLFTLAAHSATRARDRERARLYARLLMRATTTHWAAPKCDRVEELLNTLASLSVSDVLVLRAIWQATRSNALNPHFTAQHLHRLVPDRSELEIASYCGRLSQAGLIVPSAGATQPLAGFTPGGPTLYQVSPLLTDLVALIEE
jgi:hypothetical protein